MKRHQLTTGNYRSTAPLLVFGILLLIITTLSCGVKRESSRAGINNFAELKELVSSREFQIENDWAEPSSGNQINLLGNPNYIRFKGDSVKLFLPYFGVRHAGGNYGGTDGGIEFEGIPEELEITESEKNKSITIEFQAEEDMEDYDFLIRLYPSGKTSTSVNSSERSTISYRGYLNKLPDGEHRE